MITITSEEFFRKKKTQYSNCNLNIFEQDNFNRIVKIVNDNIELSLIDKDIFTPTIEYSDIFPPTNSGVKIDKEINNLCFQLEKAGWFLNVPINPTNDCLIEILQIK